MSNKVEVKHQPGRNNVCDFFQAPNFRTANQSYHTWTGNSPRKNVYVGVTQTRSDEPKYRLVYIIASIESMGGKVCFTY